MTCPSSAETPPAGQAGGLRPDDTGAAALLPAYAPLVVDAPAVAMPTPGASENVRLLREAAAELEAGTLCPRHGAAVMRLAAALLARAEGDAEGLGLLVERWYRPAMDALLAASKRRTDGDGREGGPPSITFWSSSVSIDPGVGGCTFSAPTLVEAATLLREAVGP